MDKFFNYFDERYRRSILSNLVSGEGPVVTISRQTGCDAREVALRVADQLNNKSGIRKWRWIDKDIIYSIAKELNTDYNRVENFYAGAKLTNLSEMILAFSGGFISDLRIKKAIKDVILSICKEGHIVLVGRGGVSIARDIKDALHVQLIAPFYWRVDNVMKRKNLRLQEAEKYVVETDEKRFDLIQTFLDKKSANIDNLFDVTINRISFNINDTADLIVSMYEKKVACHLVQKQRIGMFY